MNTSYFKDLLEQGLGGRPNTWKTRVWLFFQNDQYKHRRSLILRREAKHRAARLFKREYSKSFVFMHQEKT